MHISSRIPFVGRDREVASARATLAETARSNGSITIVGGAAGAGKSRFVAVVQGIAEKANFLCAKAGNYAIGRTPFGPFCDLLEELAPACPQLLPVDPKARASFDHFFGKSLSGNEAHVDRRRAFVLLTDALVRASNHSPLLVAIDDAQWMDPESIEFLHYIASRIGHHRIALFLAMRDGDERALDSDLAVSLSRFARVITIECESLERRHARELIAHLLPVDRPLPGRVVDQICRLGDGRPLFLTNLVNVAVSNVGVLSLPRDVEASTRKLLRTLEPKHVRVVEAASALGRSFTLEVLVRVLESDMEIIIEALREARNLSILDEDPTLETFVFENEMVRMAIYESIFVAERRLLHRRIAEAYENELAGSDLLAEHWRRGGDAPRAAIYAERAGDAALGVGAWASARDRYLDVIEAIPGDPSVGRISEKLADACDKLGEVAMSREYYSAAIDFYGKHDGQEAKILALECLRSDAAYRCGDTETAIEAAKNVIDSAKIGSEPRFTAHVLLAVYSTFGRDSAATIAYIQRAETITVGRTLLDEIRLEWVKATLSLESTDGEEWRLAANKGLSLADSLARPATHSLALINFAEMAREAGRIDLAHEWLRRAISIADDNGLSLAGAYARCELVAERASRGELLEALEIIREIIAFQIDAPLLRLRLAAVGLPVLADLELLEEFSNVNDRKLVDIAVDMGEPVRAATTIAAFAYIEGVQGHREAASALISRALPLMDTVRFASASLLIFARFGTMSQILAVRDLFAIDHDRRANRAYRKIIESIASQAEGNDALATEALTAGITYSEYDGLRPLHAFGLELQGKRKDALVIYERCSATLHVRRLSGPRELLTKREREVATLLRRGLSNREVSELLSVSERTVENHVAAIYHKLGVRSRAEFLVTVT